MLRPDPGRSHRRALRRAAGGVGCALSLLSLLAAPAHAQDAVAEARAAAAAGDTAGALARLAAMLEQRPEDREALFARAQILAWSGDYAASGRAYDALLAAEPQNADYLFGRAQTRLWAGQPERALADVREARAVAPGYAALDELERQASAALPVVATAVPVAAPPRSREAATEAGFEDLDRGYDSWRSLTARVRVPVSSALELRGSIAEMSRFGLGDSEGGAGASWSTGDRWTIGADLTVAGNARFLPQWSAQVQAARRIATATTLQAGYRRAEYRSTRNDTFSLAVEHYVSRYRLAYTLFRGEPAAAPGTWSHVLRGDFYYAESSSIGLQYTTGRESESDGAGGLIISRVAGAALVGRQAIATHWTVNWALTWHEQGDLYRRAGANVGIARRF